MINFQFISPTKIYFGKGVEKEVGIRLKEKGFQNVLFIYGQSSIKKIGLYDTIINSLNEANINYYELSGIEPNPKVDKVKEGIALSKEKNIDCILAVGGGSVIDTAKLISVAHHSNVEPFAFNLGIVKPTKAIPIVTVLTISAAGSELSNSCVISDPKTNLKRGFNSDLIRPMMAFLNPELTYSVSKRQTACGVVDSLMHTLERFLVEENADVTKNIGIGIMKAILKNGLIAFNDPKNYEARANLMLASSLSHNGLTNLGMPMYFTVHKLEHELSGFYDEVAHAEGLSILWLAWARYVLKDHAHLFQQLAKDVLELSISDDALMDGAKAIDYLEDYFKKIAMPTRLGDLSVEVTKLQEMAKSAIAATPNGYVLGINNLNYEDILKIYEMAK